MLLKQEDAVYAEGFHSSQEGHAVWPKILSSEMKPGACGYFNGDRDWVTIVQLTDIESVKEVLNFTPATMTKTAPNVEDAKRVFLNTAPDLTPLEGIRVTNIGGSTEWSERRSNTMSRKVLDLQGAVIPDGAAAGAKAGIQYTCEASRGAVLVARPLVTCARLVTESGLINWVNENIETLVHKGNLPSIKKRGLWTTRKTYHAPACVKSVIQGKDKNVTIHVGVKVPNEGDASASAAWWDAQHAGSGWIVQRTVPLSLGWFTSIDDYLRSDNQQANDAPIVGTEENLGVVMFFGGIWWRRGSFHSRKWKALEEQKRQDHLGDDTGEPFSVVVADPQVTDSDSEEAVLKLVPGVVGARLPFDRLPMHHDSFEMYAEDSE